PVVVRIPPFTFNQSCAPGNLVRISESPVALQHPCHVLFWLEVLGRPAAGGDDPASQHWHFLQCRRGCLRPHKIFETRGWVSRNMEEGEGWSLDGKFV